VVVARGGVPKAGKTTNGIDDNISGEKTDWPVFPDSSRRPPRRYAGMGKNLPWAACLTWKGMEKALRVFEELSADTENDILDYEKAIIYYHDGDSGKCEQLLIKAIGLNPVNPLCNIGLAQLYTETGRVPEALQVLERMISSDLITEQATLMQGDLYSLIGDESNAVESYSRLLASPKFVRRRLCESCRSSRTGAHRRGCISGQKICQGLLLIHEMQELKRPVGVGLDI
jgi:tetratricopeptide (TPR) repeat protein